MVNLMPNPLFNALGGMQNMPGPLSNIGMMMQSFNQFASAFTGDPKQKVQELLNSGRMSQAQFNQLQQMAQQFRNMMPK